MAFKQAVMEEVVVFATTVCRQCLGEYRFFIHAIKETNNDTPPCLKVRGLLQNLQLFEMFSLKSSGVTHENLDKNLNRKIQLSSFIKKEFQSHVSISNYILMVMFFLIQDYAILSYGSDEKQRVAPFFFFKVLNNKNNNNLRKCQI